MRQEHLAGEKCFVDYCGKTMPVTDRHTGEIRQAQIFVGVMGASNYTYAEATFSQTLPDWIGSHIRMLEYFGAFPRNPCAGQSPKAASAKPAAMSLTPTRATTTSPIIMALL